MSCLFPLHLSGVQICAGTGGPGCLAFVVCHELCKMKLDQCQAHMGTPTTCSPSDCSCGHRLAGTYTACTYQMISNGLWRWGYSAVPLSVGLFLSGCMLFGGTALGFDGGLLVSSCCYMLHESSRSRLCIFEVWGVGSTLEAWLYSAAWQAPLLSCCRATRLSR